MARVTGAHWLPQGRDSSTLMRGWKAVLQVKRGPRLGHARPAAGAPARKTLATEDIELGSGFEAGRARRSDDAVKAPVGDGAFGRVPRDLDAEWPRSAACC